MKRAKNGVEIGFQEWEGGSEIRREYHQYVVVVEKLCERVRARRGKRERVVVSSWVRIVRTRSLQ